MATSAKAGASKGFRAGLLESEGTRPEGRGPKAIGIDRDRRRRGAPWDGPRGCLRGLCVSHQPPLRVVLMSRPWTRSGGAAGAPRNHARGTDLGGSTLSRAHHWSGPWTLR